MVLASEMNAAAVITDIAYDIHSVDGSGDGQFFGFEMRLCHTSLSELTDDFEANYDGNIAVIVATANPLTIPNAADVWYSIPDMSSFPYNGTDNLIIETRWSSNNGISYDCYCDDGTTNRNLEVGDYDGTTGDLSTTVVRKKLTVQ